MITIKHKKIKNTSPLTKLRDPANKFLHHQSKQAIHKLHNTNFFSKLIKPCIALKSHQMPTFKMKPSCSIYLSKGGKKP